MHAPVCRCVFILCKFLGCASFVVYGGRIWSWNTLCPIFPSRFEISAVAVPSQMLSLWSNDCNDSCVGHAVQA